MNEMIMKECLRRFIEEKSLTFWVEEVRSYRSNDEASGIGGEYICECSVKKSKYVAGEWKTCFVNMRAFDDWQKKRSPIHWEDGSAM